MRETRRASTSHGVQGGPDGATFSTRGAPRNPQAQPPQLRTRTLMRLPDGSAPPGEEEQAAAAGGRILPPEMRWASSLRCALVCRCRSSSGRAAGNVGSLWNEVCLAVTEIGGGLESARLVSQRCHLPDQRRQVKPRMECCEEVHPFRSGHRDAWLGACRQS